MCGRWITENRCFIITNYTLIITSFMKTLSIYSIFIFLLTGYYHEARAQVVGGQGRVESSAPKSTDKNSVLQNGFYANVLFQGVFGRVRLIDYGTSYLIDPAFSIGFDIGNVWYLGKSTKYGNGISVIWARTNYSFQEDASGDLSVVQSFSILKNSRI